MEKSAVVMEAEAAPEGTCVFAISSHWEIEGLASGQHRPAFLAQPLHAAARTSRPGTRRGTGCPLPSPSSVTVFPRLVLRPAAHVSLITATRTPETHPQPRARQGQLEKMPSHSAGRGLAPVSVLHVFGARVCLGDPFLGH